MTDPEQTTPEQDADEVRVHPQDPAEGADEETERKDDVPRVHGEEPAEG
jgi:hypothetical protein